MSRYKMKWAFKGDGSKKQLNVSVGDLLTLNESKKAPSGWLYAATVFGQEGFVPVAYCEALPVEEAPKKAVSVSQEKAEKKEEDLLADFLKEEMGEAEELLHKSESTEERYSESEVSRFIEDEISANEGDLAEANAILDQIISANYAEEKAEPKVQVISPKTKIVRTKSAKNKVPIQSPAKAPVKAKNPAKVFSKSPRKLVKTKLKKQPVNKQALKKPVKTVAEAKLALAEPHGDVDPAAFIRAKYAFKGVRESFFFLLFLFLFFFRM
jgi:hypothetical protein